MKLILLLKIKLWFLFPDLHVLILLVPCGFLKQKFNADGSLIGYKACLVANSRNQQGY